MLWNKTIATIGIEQMSHRPPLPKRWVIYCILAYLVPIIMLEALPDTENGYAYKEISWLATLAPAFIFSLHFGMLGALAGLLAGTALYIAVQLSLNLHLMPVNQQILLPIYISYGALAIAVGWLSQQLHDFYQRMIRAERLAAIGEVAMTIRHEAQNALAAITGEAGLLAQSPGLTAQDRAGVETILEMAGRVNADVQKLSRIGESGDGAHRDVVEMLDGPRLMASPPKP